MKNLSALFVTTLVAGAAVAGPTCTVPQEKWMGRPGLQGPARPRATRSRPSKVSPGPVLRDLRLRQNGRKVEIYFDPRPAP